MGGWRRKETGAFAEAAYLLDSGLMEVKQGGCWRLGFHPLPGPLPRGRGSLAPLHLVGEGLGRG
jgi:hypothetical protein